MANSTIYDVAKLAGVSPATVSRFVNQTSPIDKLKSSRIRLAIDQLGYHPRKRLSQEEKALKIGILLPSFDCPFSNKILTGIKRLAEQSQSQLITESSNWQRPQEIQHLKYFRNLNLDGVIVILGLAPAYEVKAILGKIPVLFSCRKESPEAQTLNINNLVGGKMATNHLLQLGHTRIAHLTGPKGVFDGECRLEGYKQSLQNAGLVVDSSLIINGGFSLESGLKATRHLLQSGTEFTAIFAANDHSAFGAIQALNQHGLKVPDDISVVGFDDHEMCPYFIPQLTTVRQPLFEFGRLAFQSIQATIIKKGFDAPLPPFELVVRKSTAHLLATKD
ncbi:transcriptional regulator [Photobacterium rosenbergii]|uniref:Transcriptional regulator n=1 Tax=Photobacterium rosenbergii TaxID=294936 RepID=A0A2T3N8J9_9GAMM|nr:substrate-binding domain-containing protein [Photobacterium rosenbergii]PSW09422.1 transcriptional regulator [Photobacterium rosenbergii]